MNSKKEILLAVPKTGEYTTTISAYHAKGWLEVKEEEDR